MEKSLRFINGAQAEELVENLKKVGKHTITNNHYRAEGEIGSFDIWLYDELETLLQVFVFDISLNELFEFEDIQTNEDIYTIRFALGAKVDYSDTQVGHGSPVGAVIYNSGQTIKNYIQPNQRLRGVTCRVEKAFLKRMSKENWKNIEGFLSLNKPWIYYESITPEMEQCILDMLQLQQNVNGRYGFTTGKIFELVTLFFLQFFSNRSLKAFAYISPRDKEILFEIKDRLLFDLTKSLSLQELSRDYGINIAKLRNLFFQVFGSTPLQFVMKERLFEAKRQIIMTNKSITEIADITGFTDTSHLGKLYRREFGVAPLVHRKRK
ncbi:helix-turn-helix domain-containing protein [Sediminitomix flava]|uniref:AraC-like DNA-binding protein n=1 Tax=Sediminitomix flava TaxID=379075 RepID=A0A315Z8R2_SEDFL|nr:AraC family transcriptional regulator [Sediminitomix flava]PWJ41770.1 AraC-like DNA-binding protein [Sediminitomix flava]